MIRIKNAECTAVERAGASSNHRPLLAGTQEALRKRKDSVEVPENYAKNSLLKTE